MKKTDNKRLSQSVSLQAASMYICGEGMTNVF